MDALKNKREAMSDICVFPELMFPACAHIGEVNARLTGGIAVLLYPSVTPMVRFKMPAAVALSLGSVPAVTSET